MDQILNRYWLFLETEVSFKVETFCVAISFWYVTSFKESYNSRD